MWLAFSPRLSNDFKKIGARHEAEAQQHGVIALAGAPGEPGRRAEAKEVLARLQAPRRAPNSTVAEAPGGALSTVSKLGRRV